MTFGYRFESGDGSCRYLGELLSTAAPGRHLMPLTPNFGASRSQQPSSLFKNPWATALICPHLFAVPSRKVHGYRLHHRSTGLALWAP